MPVTRGLAAVGLLTIGGACASDAPEVDAAPLAAPNGTTALETSPDPAVVTYVALRAAIVETGLPWRIRHDASGVELLLVPRMSFQRGAVESDTEATADERPAHAVEVRAPFYLGRYEVSQAEWERLMGDTPSFFPPEPDGRARPVERVTFFRAQEFAAAAGLVLPTESQWEAACRAGTTAPRYGPLDDVAWHRGNAGGQAHASGEKAGNALGFHDLLGNVWEWTSSGFVAEEYERHTKPIDARGRVRGAPRAVLRGGSYFDPAKRARASARYATERELNAAHVGLRVALEL